MFLRTRRPLCFVQLAATAAAEFAQLGHKRLLVAMTGSSKQDTPSIGATRATSATSAFAARHDKHPSCSTSLQDTSALSASFGAADPDSSAEASLWIDDTAEAARAKAEHIASPEYKELHRPALTTSAMGLFGGEAGFEKAHRVWVDPDRPHMKHIYNQTALAKNLRYTRYGYFKRDMQLLDIDKLIRHARMLPTPNRLLTDFLYQRVPLPDHSCAALLRYQREQITMLEPWRRDTALGSAEEMFERLVVTNIPPVEVGAGAHAEMIRCCALCANWNKGWEVYFRRAREIAQTHVPPKHGRARDGRLADSQRNSDDDVYTITDGGHTDDSRMNDVGADHGEGREEDDWDETEAGDDSVAGFVMTTDIYDAVLELCLACERTEEGMAVLAQAIREHLRPRTTMLDTMLVLLSVAGEKLNQPDLASIHESNATGLDRHNVANRLPFHGAAGDKEIDDDDDANAAMDETRNRADEAEKDDAPDVEDELSVRRHTYATCGMDVWSLYDFYRLPRTTTSVECYLRMCALCHPSSPTLTIQALHMADAVGIRLSLTCYHWLVYSARPVPDFGDYLVDIFTQLRTRGLTPDHILFTLCFMYCAVQKDGELAMTLYTQFFAASSASHTRSSSLADAMVNPTTEMTLLFVQACAQCAVPRVDMLACCEAMMDRLESIGSVRDGLNELYDQFMELAGRLGAVGSAYSRIKRLVSFGKPLTTRMLNSLLLANAHAEPPMGGLAMTQELVQFFQLLHVSPNDDTLACLSLCMQRHGSCAAVDALYAKIRAQQQAAQPLCTLGRDAEVTVMQLPPHRLRQLCVDWHVRPRDIILRRFGQHVKPSPREQVGSMVGSVVPFGRSPGERVV